MPTDRPITLNRFLHAVLALTVVGALVWLLYTLRAVLIPFFVALLLAYLVDPWVARVQRRVRNRVAAVSIVLVLLLGAVMGALLWTVPMIVREVHHFAALMSVQLPVWMARVQDIPWVHDLLEQAAAVDPRRLLTGENISGLVRKVLPGFWQGISSVFGWMLGLVGVFTTLIYLIFILIDEEDVKADWEELVPPKYRSVVAGVAADVGQAMDRYFRGQLKIAVLLSVVYVVGFGVVGLPMAVLLGLMAGMLSMIPYFALLSVPPVMLSAGLLALDQGGSFWPPMLGALAVYAVAQALEGFVLVPRIQGKNTGLRPEYVLLALSVWGSLLGVVGMIIALPLTTVILSYYRRVVLGEEEVPSASSAMDTAPPAQPPAPST